MHLSFTSGSDDVIVFSNTISFDAHILQVMPPLFLGAKMVIARPKGHMDPDYMARLIIENDVTSMVFTVPTLVRAVLCRCSMFMFMLCLCFFLGCLRLICWYLSSFDAGC